MAAVIISNGCTIRGEPPATLGRLIELLGEETLDPAFEDVGGFVSPDEDHPGQLEVLGNFFSVSHLFQIRGTAEELRELIAAIAANQATPDYAAAKIARQRGQRHSPRRSIGRRVAVLMVAAIASAAACGCKSAEVKLDHKPSGVHVVARVER